MAASTVANTPPLGDLWSVVKGPLKQRRVQLFLVIASLIGLSFSQAMLLLSIKGLFSALFGTGDQTTVMVGDILPRESLSWLSPELQQWQFPRLWLHYAVPSLLLSAGLVKSLSTYIYQLNQQGISLFVAQDLRTRLFDRLLHRPFLEIKAKSPGAWMSVIMNDVMSLQMRLSEMMTGLIKDSVLVLSGLCVLALMHWPSAVAVLLLCPFISFGMGKAASRIARYAERFQHELARIAAAILDLRRRMEFIHAQEGVAREKTSFCELNESYYRSIMRSLKVRAAFAPGLEWLGFMVFAGFVALIGFGQLGGGWRGEDVLQFVAALGVLIKPLRNLGEQLTRFQETRGSLHRSLRLLKSPPVAASRPRGRSPQSLPTLTIDEVAVSYRGEPAVRVSGIRIEPGSAVAIIGPTGSGKSSLLKCLSGLVEPSTWKANLDWRSLAAATVAVPQQPFLFDASIRENLAYGTDPATNLVDEDIWRALEQAGVSDEIKALPKQLETRIQAIDANVSGGQLQRLVIARALLRDRPVLLLDEATSALDADVEADIIRRLVAWHRAAQRFLIAVTHRLEQLSEFDQVLFIENGGLVCCGPYKEVASQARYQMFIGSEAGTTDASI